jgi:hypothetical protein
MSPDRPSFVSVLNELRDGAVLHELEDGFAELLQAVRTTDRKGRLTLSLVIEPSDPPDKSIIVADEVTIQIPHPRKTTVLFPEELVASLPFGEDDPDFKERQAGPDA